MEKKNFSDIGKIEAIKLLFEESPFKQADSTSYLCGEKGGVIRTASKLWLEGIDFDLTYFPLKHLGYKSVVGTVGEIYASLARPQSISVRLGISAKLDLPQVSELWNGICTAAEEHHIKRADLDLVPSRNGLTISIVISGITSPEVAENRKSASSKDLICISGNVGASFLGMSLLEQEKKKFEKAGELTGQPDLEKYKMLVASYMKPEIDPDIVSQLGDSGIIPPYGYLVNRGLADAARRLNRDSGLGVKLYTDKIPFEGNSFEVGKKLNIDPVSAALKGGDDYRLMFVIPMSAYETFRHDFQTFSIIGHLAQPEVGTVLVTHEGVELPVHAQGWNNDILY
ncbi:MAG: hypothetical protein LKJ87_04755 [Bacteroidales bacterium]|jgi:thiamine-monophosphate kinase|nr:hypothetical protein [Bacteroidales bacterium]